ncbi:MAG TPA: hypothetical protein DCW29_14190 [Janthinobacterium sp.]|nr:hypothetical protein [Janthinobacterium sp.]
MIPACARGLVRAPPGVFAWSFIWCARLPPARPYVGPGLATAGLLPLTARRGEQPILGNVTAMFVLAQPAGLSAAAVRPGVFC